MKSRPIARSVVSAFLAAIGAAATAAADEAPPADTSWPSYNLTAKANDSRRSTKDSSSPVRQAAIGACAGE
jgi:hypothetical protein